MATIEWETLPHAELTRVLSEGLAERDRRVQELYSLTGAIAPTEERRGPGRPAGSGNKQPPMSARAQQLLEASGKAPQAHEQEASAS